MTAELLLSLIFDVFIILIFFYFKAMDSTGSRTKTPPYASSSTVLLVPENGCEKQTILLLTLLAREYDLKLSLTLKKKLHCQLNVRFM